MIGETDGFWTDGALCCGFGVWRNYAKLISQTQLSYATIFTSASQLLCWQGYEREEIECKMRLIVQCIHYTKLHLTRIYTV